MTLDRLRPLISGLLDPFVRGAVAVGATPNAVSVAAFGLAVAAGAAFAVSEGAPLYAVAGAVLVFANGWLDVLDGALARELGTDSEAGDMLDHVLDRYADIAILVGLAAGVDAYALGLAAVTGVLMTSYLGTQTQAVGLERTYGGLLGRADRLALVGVVGVLVVFLPRIAGRSPLWWLLVLFAVVGHFTALQRFWGAYRDLS
jgi:archaetidylinositol phosphate synthase